MIVRHGFPAGTDRAKARTAALAAYRKQGGTADSPLVEYSEGDGELLVVVRSEAKPEPAQPRRKRALSIPHGSIPDDLYERLDAHLRAQGGLA